MNNYIKLLKKNSLAYGRFQLPLFNLSVYFRVLALLDDNDDSKEINILSLESVLNLDLFSLYIDLSVYNFSLFTIEIVKNDCINDDDNFVNTESTEVADSIHENGNELNTQEPQEQLEIDEFFGSELDDPYEYS